LIEDVYLNREDAENAVFRTIPSALFASLRYFFVSEN